MNDDNNNQTPSDNNWQNRRPDYHDQGIYGYRDEKPAGKSSRRISIRAVLALVVLIMAVVVWIAYPDGESNYDDAELPLVRADNSPYKTAPESRGGESVPYQDSTIFEAIEDTDSDEVELLLPEEEAPAERAEIVRGSDNSLVQEPDMNLDVQLLERDETQEKAQIIAVPQDPVEEPAPAEDTTTTSQSETPVASTTTTTTTTASAPAAGNSFIQLGAFRGQTEAEQAYAKAVESYGSILAGADVKYERADLGEKGIYYRVKVGPMADSEAKSRCERIKDIKSGGCFVTR